jgi:hypothetical protein
MEDQNNRSQKRRWTNDPAMFFVTLAGFVVLVFYTVATFRQARLVGEQAQLMNSQLKVMHDQLAEMKSSSGQTERAIETSNRIANAALRSSAETQRIANAAEKSSSETRRLADATAQTTTESRRLADASTQATIITNRMADAAVQSVAASSRLADSATQATEINRQALIAVQRPFMFVKDVEFVKFLNSIAIHIRVMWENSGNTPTKDLTLYNGCVSSDTPLTDPLNTKETIFWGQKTERQLNEYKMFFGPKQSTYALGCVMSTFLVAFEQILKSRFLLDHYLYIIGKAEYRDPFNPEYLHVTEYCRIVVDLKTEQGDSTNPLRVTGDTLPCRAIIKKCGNEN